MEAVVNETALEAVIDLVNRLGERIDARKPALDGILNIRGVLEFRDPELSDADRAMRAMRPCLQASWRRLGAQGNAAVRRRGSEPRSGRSDRPYRSTYPCRRGRSVALARGDPRPSRRTGGALMDTGAGLDRDRLHMEAALLATKADLREEIDRLKAHVEAARTLDQRGREAQAAGSIFSPRNSTVKPIPYARSRMRLP
jgi:hypothetical protein